MNRMLVLKAIADETRMKILSLLLCHSYCVRALAGKLELTEGAVSQHLKVLRASGLLTGEKKGYFMHYDVNRDVLHGLAAEIEALASMERELCTPEDSHLTKGEKGHEHHGHCHCHQSE